MVKLYKYYLNNNNNNNKLTPDIVYSRSVYKNGRDFREPDRSQIRSYMPRPLVFPTCANKCT